MSVPPDPSQSARQPLDLEPYADGVSYIDELPLRWQAPGDAAIQCASPCWQDENTRLLTTIARIEERAAPPEDPTPVEQELHRLHLKIDFMLEAIGGLVNRDRPPPPATSLRLSWRAIAWRALGSVPETGTAGTVELFIHPAMAQPLRLPARILRVENDVVCAGFEELGEPLQLALERHVFLHHRRAVAEHRSQGRRN